jgi:hypothetical protein
MEVLRKGLICRVWLTGQASGASGWMIWEESRQEEEAVQAVVTTTATTRTTTLTPDGTKHNSAMGSGRRKIEGVDR